MVERWVVAPETQVQSLSVVPNCALACLYRSAICGANNTVECVYEKLLARGIFTMTFKVTLANHTTELIVVDYEAANQYAARARAVDEIHKLYPPEGWPVISVHLQKINVHLLESTQD